MEVLALMRLGAYWTALFISSDSDVMAP
jgi:hypothetical protein